MPVSIGASSPSRSRLTSPSFQVTCSCISPQQSGEAHIHLWKERSSLLTSGRVLELGTILGLFEMRTNWLSFI